MSVYILNNAREKLHIIFLCVYMSCLFHLKIKKSRKLIVYYFKYTLNSKI